MLTLVEKIEEPIFESSFLSHASLGHLSAIVFSF